MAVGFVAVQDRYAAVQAGSLPKLFADDSSCVRSRAAEIAGTREEKRNMFQIWRVSENVLVALSEASTCVMRVWMISVVGPIKVLLLTVYVQGLPRSYVSRDVSTLVMKEGPRLFCVSNSDACCEIEFG